jgi:hypothetical protein
LPGRASRGVRRGRAAILASFLARRRARQRHVIANVVVDVEDADHARAFSVIVLYMGDVPQGAGCRCRTRSRR